MLFISLLSLSLEVEKLKESHLRNIKKTCWFFWPMYHLLLCFQCCGMWNCELLVSKLIYVVWWIVIIWEVLICARVMFIFIYQLGVSLFDLDYKAFLRRMALPLVSFTTQLWIWTYLFSNLNTLQTSISKLDLKIANADRHYVISCDPFWRTSLIGHYYCATFPSILFV